MYRKRRDSLDKRNLENKLQIEDFLIDKKHKQKQIIGYGSFSVVYQAFCKLDMKKYAIKVVK